MPELNGIEAAKKIRKSSEKTEILMLSMHYSDQIIRDVMDAGIRGYVVKSDSDRDLSSALESLASHKPFYSNRVSEVIANPPRRERRRRLEEARQPRHVARKRDHPASLGREEQQGSRGVCSTSA